MAVKKKQSSSACELTDLLTEGINAVLELQKSYAYDWAIRLHHSSWAKEWAK